MTTNVQFLNSKDLIVDMSESIKNYVKIKVVVGSLPLKDQLLPGVSTKPLLILAKLLTSKLPLSLSPKITSIPCMVTS